MFQDQFTTLWWLIYWELLSFFELNRLVTIWAIKKDTWGVGGKWLGYLVVRERWAAVQLGWQRSRRSASRGGRLDHSTPSLATRCYARDLRPCQWLKLTPTEGASGCWRHGTRNRAPTHIPGPSPASQKNSISHTEIVFRVLKGNQQCFSKLNFDLWTSNKSAQFRLKS